jgi:hypothetical protein
VETGALPGGKTGRESHIIFLKDTKETPSLAWGSEPRNQFYLSGDIVIPDVPLYFFKLLIDAFTRGIPSDIVINVIYKLTMSEMDRVKSCKSMTSDEIDNLNFKNGTHPALDSCVDMVKLNLLTEVALRTGAPVTVIPSLILACRSAI